MDATQLPPGPLAPQTLQPSSPCWPRLDLVRGIAIAMVLVDHGLASDLSFYRAYGSRAMTALGYLFSLGHLGVELFFVLSGVLITGILLDSRGRADYLRSFYLRRILRIVPAYLAMIAVLYATHSVTGRYVVVCLLFLCNMSSAMGTGDQYGPFWSLAVEEQFYLLWPILVRRLSQRALAILCVVLVAMTPLLRLALLYGPAAVRDIRFKTWDVADFFAAGALIALAWRSERWRPKMATAAVWLMVCGAVTAIFLPLLGTQSGFAGNLSRAVHLEPWLLGFSGLVLCGMTRPAFAAGLPGRAMIFLAKISYGLYLCHALVFHWVEHLWILHAAGGERRLPSLLVRFVVETAVAVAIAALSRYTLEEFFLRLKSKERTSAPER